MKTLRIVVKNSNRPRCPWKNSSKVNLEMFQLFIIEFSVEGGEVDCVAPLEELSKKTKTKRKKNKYILTKNTICVCFVAFLLGL